MRYWQQNHITDNLTENNDEDKKIKGTEKCAMKRKLNFNDCKNVLEATQFENKINQLKKQSYR